MRELTALSVVAKGKESCGFSVWWSMCVVISYAHCMGQEAWLREALGEKYLC